MPMELQETDRINMARCSNYDVTSGSARTKWYMEKRFYLWMLFFSVFLIAVIGLFLGGYYTGLSAANVNNADRYVTDEVNPTAETVSDVLWDGVCPKSKAQCPDSFQGVPPLLLISLDGFRPDYLTRNLTPTLKNLSLCGTSTPYIYPVFPSKTFPNHFSIVTGLYPSSHGIVGNKMYDPVDHAVFKIGSPGYLNSSWWKVDPIWVTAQNQSKKCACFFWPGSEADINGVHPTYYKNYEMYLPFEDRVDGVLEWLDKPADTRPDFITLYVHEPDKAAHENGIGSKQVNDALVQVDKTISRLLSGLQRRDLLNCVNIIIMSDHGMTDSGCDKLIRLQDFIDVSEAWIIDGAFARIRLYDEKLTVLENMTTSLQCKDKHMRSYPKAQLPIRYHYASHRRIEPIFVDLDLGWTITSSNKTRAYGCKLGSHGYDNYFDDMRTLFIAYGPGFKFNNTVLPFANTELYELMAELINITANANNGTRGSLHSLLQSPDELPPQEEPEPPATATVPDKRIEYDLRVHAANCSCAQEKLQHNIENTTSLRSVHLPFGMPYSPEDHAALKILYNNDYIAAYDPKYRLSMWTAYSVLRKINVQEPNPCWKGDARIHYENTAKCSDYNDSVIIQQGIFPSALFPPAFARDIYIEETFLVNNMAPKHEIHINFIEKYFNQLIETWYKFRSSINIVTGPAFDLLSTGVRPDIGTIMQLHGKYHALVVPTHYFYVVAWCKVKDVPLGECSPSMLDASAYLLPNIPIVENCETPDALVKKNVARVADVEALTGLTFFTGLPTYDAIRLRTKVPEL